MMTHALCEGRNGRLSGAPQGNPTKDGMSHGGDAGAGACRSCPVLSVPPLGKRIGSRGTGGTRPEGRWPFQPGGV